MTDDKKPNLWQRMMPPDPPSQTPQQSAETAQRWQDSMKQQAATPATHQQIVQSRLAWIVGGVWVLAGATIANIIIGFASAVS